MRGKENEKTKIQKHTDTRGERQGEGQKEGKRWRGESMEPKSPMIDTAIREVETRDNAEQKSFLKIHSPSTL